MVEKVADRLIEKLTIRKTLSDHMKEWYKYVLVEMIEKILGVFVVALAGFATGRFPEVLVYYFFVRGLRQWTGGYHCERSGQCLLLSVCVAVMAIVSEKAFCCQPWIIVFGITLSVIIILIIGTVNHINMNLTLGELKRMKRRARCVAVVEALSAFAFVVVRCEHYASYMVSAMLTCAVSMAAAKIIKQEVQR